MEEEKIFCCGRGEEKHRRIIIKFFIVLLKHNVEVMPVKEKRVFPNFSVPAEGVLVLA
jgi:hypothetical protein